MFCTYFMYNDWMFCVCFFFVLFFSSAVAVLKDNGEVHVTLCNGQGGTPCDSPMREWHNSWQVVAMAAEAGLILSEIRPFDCEMYQGYRCTGYR